MHPEARTRPAAAATQPGELFIHTLVVEPKIGDGTAGDSVQKPVLLLIPGFACGHAVFFRQLDQFAKAFRVFAVDLLGFGLSARPPFQDSPDGLTRLCAPRFRQSA
jgi:pimeloyl-ACP methyl ester carboxylesterase